MEIGVLPALLGILSVLATGLHLTRLAKKQQKGKPVPRRVRVPVSNREEK